MTNVSFGFVSNGTAGDYDHWFIDDVVFECYTSSCVNDIDCDGTITALDCDDNDATVYWGPTDDYDGDGVECSLDCDDTDATTWLDCDPEWIEDFETGTSTLFTNNTGSWEVNSLMPFAGSYNLMLYSGSATVTSDPLDVSGCLSIDWQYMKKMGGAANGFNNPESSDVLRFKILDGSGNLISEVDTVPGVNGSAGDSYYSQRSGTFLLSGQNSIKAFFE